MLEKINVKSEEENSSHWEQHVQRSCGEKKQGKNKGLKDGVCGLEWREWGKKPGLELKKEAGAN